MKRVVTLMVVVWGLVELPGRALAGAIVPGGPTPWYEFLWNGSAGTFALNGTGAVPSSGGNSQFADNPAWTFTSPAGGSIFTVADAFIKGDAFNVFDFGTAIGTTPLVATSSLNNTTDPAVSVLDSTYSHATFVLAPGNHSITISLAVEVATTGAGYFRVDNAAVTGPSAVPIPSAGLGGATLCGLMALARRRRTAAV